MIRSRAILDQATRRSRERGFTLAEMLVVLVIIGLLAALALPNIRGNLESRAISAACRQLTEDLSLARQRAISQRGTVAVVFLPEDVLSVNYSSTSFTKEERDTLKRLQAGAYTHYAIFSFRRVGEQPGRHTHGYITEWKSLPEKTFLATNQFLISEWTDTREPALGALLSDQFPFPLSSSPKASFPLPYIAFGPDGRLVRIGNPLTGAPTPEMYSGVRLEVSRGAILYVRDANDGIVPASFDLQEIPPNNSTQNVIRVEGLTGRAKWIPIEPR